ncbi:2,3-dihydro-2,3-dihydroxybenzoate dehydrogenase [Kibdelosporangium persicum]|uniref:2,3-dihydro-2,3-dihydroxybenzoate dehydrogenase n=1 Tax=Kibdelosporangium persicum TaxID=2698649 RepID=A0ABX2EW60_9PSEU|nr:2,3-dihydro-2,3-dihydroxybenzoate dehydrogenase [Kibdelosporangium persicum]NRN63217.1 2-hydroxycyclohexanecarboxyl-CoA dehydrogenase [Kibdelosporangium persicum]
MVAVVTGAAGGIGTAVARRLAGTATTVAMVDREATALAEAVEKLTADGLPVCGFLADVADSAEVESVVAEVEDRLGPVESLVNAAGVLRLGDARHCADDDWDVMFAVNAAGVFRMSRAVVNRMVPRGRGAIVTVASNAAGTPRSGMSGYAASKAAAVMLTKSMGLEVARYGIRCNVVAPGSTDTAMLRSMWHGEAGPKATLEGDLAAYRLGIPLGKIGQPSDVADAVGFLLSDRAGHITMATLTVDGGATLGV